MENLKMDVTRNEENKDEVVNAMKRKVIFLDVDGVLNNRKTTESSPGNFTGVDLDLVRNLKKVVDETSAEIVLTSDWKKLWDREENKKDADYRYLERMLKKYDLQIVDVTDDESDGDDITSERGAGIKRYLDAHPEVEGYVILDDARFEDFVTLGFKDAGKVIYTHPGIGLDEASAKNAIEVLIG